MMAFLKKLLFFALLHYFFISLAISATTSYQCCSDTPVVFTYENPDELKCLCSTANAAIAFLTSIGLETTDCTTIRVVNHIPTNQAHTLFGAYDCSTQEVYMLTYSKAAELSKGDQQAFGIDMNEDLWCSFAAHELAHVISEKFLGSQIRAHTAGEYISYVTQLTVLATETREKVLATYRDVEAYQSRNEMSELYYLLDPNRFAVKSYLHFISLKEPKKFIKRLCKEGNGH